MAKVKNAQPRPDPRDEVETDEEIPGGRLSIDAARLLDNMRGIDIVIYDLRGRSDVTDYFVVAAGEHYVHLRAMALDLVDHFRRRGVQVLGVEGLEGSPSEPGAPIAVTTYPDAGDEDDDDPESLVAPTGGGTWILVDYADCIIHLFSREARAYYDLDLLWGDAPKVEWEEQDTDKQVNPS